MHREKWTKGGYRSFHVEHRIPQSVAEGKILEYENLVYSCDMCNTFKSNEIMPDPFEVPLGLHYEFDADGGVRSLSGRQGQEYIEILGLDDESAVDYRARLLRTLRDFSMLCDKVEAAKRIEMLERWFGYPVDIPDLRAYRPKKNSKDENKRLCYYVLLKNGEIPRIY